MKFDFNGGITSAMYPRNLFIYDSYFHCWSRVLRFANVIRGESLPQIEVNLTAINGTEEEWARTRKILIRAHRTARRDNQVISKVLPLATVEKMKLWMNDETFDRLVHDDLFSEIDWKKYAQVRVGGGTPLELILK